MGTQVPPPKQWASHPPIFSPCLLRPNGWIKMPLRMEVDLSPGHLLLDGHPAHTRRRTAPPIFGPCLLWPNGWMDQDEIWHAGKHRPRTQRVRWGTSSPSPKGAQPLQFSAHICCGQRTAWIKMPLRMEVGLAPGHIMLDGDPAPPQKGTAAPPIFGPCLLWPNGWMDQDITSYGGRPRPRPHC